MSDDILIVGGGLAGLSAAHQLIQKNHDVTILEKRQRLGGRASSYELNSFPLSIDNCQHILTGSCRYCLRLIRETTGDDGPLESHRSIPVLTPAGSIRYWELGDHSPPFHLWPLFRAVCEDLGQTLRDGLRLIPLWLPGHHDGLTAYEWLRKYQSRHLIDNLWRPLTTSALNETLERLSFEQFQKWVLTGLSGTTTAPTIYIPGTSLKNLYGGGVGEHLESRGVTIHRSTRVKRILPRKPGVVVDDGSTLEPDVVISALEDRVLWARLPRDIRNRTPFSRIPDWEHAPIVSVHLLFEGSFQLPDFLLLQNSLFEWMFALRQPPEDYTYLQCVKSAAWESSGWDKQRLVERAVHDLDSIVPGAGRLAHSRVVKEKNATLSMRPGIARRRFGPDTPYSNFYVAGDWTKGEWPPTMESAVRSGIRVSERVDSRVESIRPDPSPRGWLRSISHILGRS